ncbi:ubiquitin-conjugating enzyme E2 [Mycobacterium tuberculosis]
MVFCPPEYPEFPPTIKFCTAINLKCIDDVTGIVLPCFSLLKEWKPTFTIQKLLLGLRNEMIIERKTIQPPENAKFPDISFQ